MGDATSWDVLLVCSLSYSGSASDCVDRFKLNIEGGDSEQVIRKTAIEKGVLALPGTAFMPGGGKSGYVRASFSLIEEKDIEEAAKRLREVVLASSA